VHLLAQARVGKHFKHVYQPALGTAEAVLTIAIAVEPAEDRELRTKPEQVLTVVEDQFY